MIRNRSNRLNEGKRSIKMLTELLKPATSQSGLAVRLKFDHDKIPNLKSQIPSLLVSLLFHLGSSPNEVLFEEVEDDFSLL